MIHLKGAVSGLKSGCGCSGFPFLSAVLTPLCFTSSLMERDSFDFCGAYLDMNGWKRKVLHKPCYAWILGISFVLSNLSIFVVSFHLARATPGTPFVCSDVMPHISLFAPVLLHFFFLLCYDVQHYQSGFKLQRIKVEIWGQSLCSKREKILSLSQILQEVKEYRNKKSIATSKTERDLERNINRKWQNILQP